jgi:hypothetical protein
MWRWRGDGCVPHRGPPLTLVHLAKHFTDHVYVIARTYYLNWYGAHQKWNIGPGEAHGRSRNLNTEPLRYRRI